MKTMFGVDGVAAHLVDRTHLDTGAVEIGIEQRQAVGPALHRLERRRAGKQQHLVRDLRGRDPDLRAADDVAPAALLGLGLERRSVEAGVGLGDGKARLVLAARDRRQHPALLLLGAEHDDRVQTEDVHVDRRGAAHRRAGLRNRLHHDRGLGDAEAGAAVFLRQRDAEPAAFRDRLMERVRKRAVAVACEPILVVEAGAELRDGVAQLELIRGEGKIHVRLAPSAEEPR